MTTIATPSLNISAEGLERCQRLESQYGIKTVNDLGRVAGELDMLPSELLASVS